MLLGGNTGGGGFLSVKVNPVKGGGRGVYRLSLIDFRYKRYE